MAGYLDTRQMIIDTLMGRPEGTQIQPEDHQAYALNLLNYVRSVELSSGSTLTGIAEADTVPIEPYDSRVAYITSVPQNTVRTFTYFKKENNEPITITTTDSSAFVILLWNTQYWEYQSLPVTVFENDSFVGYFECASLSTDTNKTISSEINQLTTDMRILVKMNNINTQDNATLQIGLTQSKPLFYNGSRVSSTNSWAQNEVLDIYYDGNNYISTTYGGAQFSTGEKVGDVEIVNIPGTNLKSVMSQKGATDLVSEYNVSTNNNNAEYTFAQAVALVPASLQKGGLTIKYIDSTTHEYAIKRLMSSTWNTTESNWQGIDAEPTAGSMNIPTSGGVSKLFSDIIGVTEEKVVSVSGTTTTATGISLTNGIRYTIYVQCSTAVDNGNTGVYIYASDLFTKIKSLTASEFANGTYFEYTPFTNAVLYVRPYANGIVDVKIWDMTNYSDLHKLNERVNEVDKTAEVGANVHIATYVAAFEEENFIAADAGASIKPTSVIPNQRIKVYVKSSTLSHFAVYSYPVSATGSRIYEIPDGTDFSDGVEFEFTCPAEMVEDQFGVTKILFRTYAECTLEEFDCYKLEPNNSTAFNDVKIRLAGAETLNSTQSVASINNMIAGEAFRFHQIQYNSDGKIISAGITWGDGATGEMTINYDGNVITHIDYTRGTAGLGNTGTYRQTFVYYSNGNIQGNQINKIA